MSPPSPRAARVPSLAEILESPALLERLPLDALIDIQRGLGHLTADVSGAIMRAMVAARSDSAPLGEQWLTADEVAPLVSVPVTYVRQLIRQGTLPAVTIGKYIRVRRSDVLAFLAKGPTTPVDTRLSTVYSRSRGRISPPSSPNPRQADPGRRGRSARRHREQRRSVGTRRGPDLGGDGTVDPSDAGDTTATT